jgi:hypothetical protein
VNASRGVGLVILLLVVGGGIFATHTYLRSRPNGVPPVTRVANPPRPSAGFGSRRTDFADPRTTTLRYVSKFERQQGVQPNVTIGGRR